MIRIFAFLLALLMSFSLLIIQGCDWDDTGSESFNTSRGGGITVNFSGYYRPRSGAFLVTSNVTHFVLTQVGNSIEVYDNNMSYYTGTIGSPGIMAGPDATGAFPAGAVMLQAQVSFSGKNAGTGKNVQFVGVIHAVAVDDVQGNTQTQTTTTTDDSVLSNSTNTSGETAIDIIAPPVTINDTTETASENSTSSGTTIVNETVATTTYQITEANSQYVLEGNWMEGGSVSGIAAIAPGTGSTFSTVTTTTTTDAP